MKRTLIIIGSVIVLILLIVRMIFVQSGKQDEARREFVSKLDYDFTAMVDSVGLFNANAPVGFIYLKMPRDTVENRERKISRGLRKKYSFRFLVPRKGRLEFFSKDARKFKSGDSLLIKAAEDKMRLMRGDSLVAEFKISEVVREGRD
jgi:hypothetical protein